MSLALYRKYRPATFAEVVGQEHVTRPLIQALKNDRMHHAYLFWGPRGCGKTSSARILARSLNCEKGPTPDPCGVCDSCVALAPGGPGSLDVIEIDAASHNGVDDARDLRERAVFAPVSSRYKVYVIDEAHMVTKQAFNALLKLVEEPPEFVKFVFATTEPDDVLQTIRSRTHHYPFRLLPPKALRELLEDLCRREGVAVEPAVFSLVVRAAGGSARDALSILDQLLAGADEGGVTYADAVPLLGVTDLALLDDVIDALVVSDGAAVFEAVDRVVEAGHDPRRFATDLLERLRDLVILDAVPDAAAKGLLDAPQDLLERMTGQAAKLGTATLSRMADVVHASLSDMRGTTSPRLLLELVCARMLLPAASGEPAAVLQRLERLERRLDIGGATHAAAPATSVSAPRSKAAAPPEPAPARSGPPAAARTDAPAATETSVPAHAEPSVEQARGPEPAADPAPAATGSISAADVRRLWPEIVSVVNQRKRVVGAYLLDATVSELDGDTLVLLFPHAFHARALQESPALEYFGDALRDVLGVTWRVRCEVSGGAAGSGGTGEGSGQLTGFAPGDGPAAEEAAGSAPRQSAEEEAISLLSKGLGARQIGDSDAG